MNEATKAKENLELPDDALNEASGGWGEIRYCSKCKVNALTTWGERETGVCSSCRNNPYGDGGHQPR